MQKTIRRLAVLAASCTISLALTVSTNLAMTQDNADLDSDLFDTCFSFPVCLRKAESVIDAMVEDI